MESYLFKPGFVCLFFISLFVKLQLHDRTAALTHLDHIAILDHGPQQFPVFCLILLLFQVCSMLYIEEENWSQRGNNGLYISLPQGKSNIASSYKNHRNKQIPKYTLRRSAMRKGFKNPTHYALFVGLLGFSKMYSFFKEFMDIWLG